MASTPSPLTPHLEVDALRRVVQWPHATQPVIVLLTTQLLAARRYREGYDYFLERSRAEPDRPLFVTLAGVFQAHLDGASDPAIAKLDDAAGRDLGLAQYYRGVTLAEFPDCAGRAETVVADLEFVLAVRDEFPPGFMRAVYRALAAAYRCLGRLDEADAALARSGYASATQGVGESTRDGASTLPALTTDSWVTAADGFRFGSPRLVERGPGVYVAQGYDFADFSFVVTDDGIVAIDTASNNRNAGAALADLRRITAEGGKGHFPVSHVIITHAHWDHVGGLDAIAEAGTEIIAQVNFPDELRLQNAGATPFPYFFAKGEGHRHDVVPHRLVDRPETLTVGGAEFALYPIPGGETHDGLVIHLPEHDIAFVGDMSMPYLGDPFLPEGSAEGLFEAMELVAGLEPRLLIHGHAPLTANYRIEVFPGLLTALRHLRDTVLAEVSNGLTLIDVLHRNHLPEALREHPDSVLPYLITRDNFIQRVHHQATGYWRPNGDGVEHFAPAEWAAALDLLGGKSADAFVSAGADLLDRGDHALALRLIDYGKIRHPDSTALDDLRRRALYGLIERYQSLNPFKLVHYAGLAGFEIAPPDSPD